MAVTVTEQRTTKLLVLYGSQTGNAQDVAERIAREGNHRYFRTECKAMDSACIQDIAKEDYVVFVCSTTGASVPPIPLRQAILNVWHNFNTIAAATFMEPSEYTVIFPS